MRRAFTVLAIGAAAGLLGAAIWLTPGTSSAHEDRWAALGVWAMVVQAVAVTAAALYAASQLTETRRQAEKRRQADLIDSIDIERLLADQYAIAERHIELIDAVQSHWNTPAAFKPKNATLAALGIDPDRLPLPLAEKLLSLNSACRQFAFMLISVAVILHELGETELANQGERLSHTATRELQLLPTDTTEEQLAQALALSDEKVAHFFSDCNAFLDGIFRVRLLEATEPAPTKERELWFLRRHK